MSFAITSRILNSVQPKFESLTIYYRIWKIWLL